MEIEESLPTFLVMRREADKDVCTAEGRGMVGT